MDELHRDGAEPVQLLADLAEAVHAAARVKAVGAEVGSEGLSAEERRRVATIAGKLSTPLLSRAWQMLLKGGEEAVKAPNPRAAAEMVLIRLAYTADLPAPDEVIRLLGGEGALARSGKPAPADGGSDARCAAQSSAAPAQPDRAPPAPVAAASDVDDAPPVDDEDPGFDADYAASFGDVVSDDDAPAPGMLADPRSFDEVIALAGERRDMMLKLQLEDRVSLVKFDYTAGSIDLFLLPGAPPQLANELREKLNAWTQRKWVVVLSKAAGERPRGEVRREREAAELEALKAHPGRQGRARTIPRRKDRRDTRADRRRRATRPAPVEIGAGRHDNWRRHRMKDMMGMMKQVGEMQARVQQMQEELAALEIDGQSGGGLVMVTLTGKGDMKKVRIDPSLVKPGEAEILEDLIVAAMADAKSKLDAKLQAKMQEVTGGLPLPPGLKLF